MEKKKKKEQLGRGGTWTRDILVVLPLWTLTQIVFHHHSSFITNNHECQYVLYTDYKGPNSVWASGKTRNSSNQWKTDIVSF